MQSSTYSEDDVDLTVFRNDLACRAICCGQTAQRSPARRKPSPNSTQVTHGKNLASLIGSASEIDVERGLSGQDEHIILSVSGMTCSGCETKLQRTLESVQNTRNIKTSLILSRAEFDVDLQRQSIADIVHYVGRATGFKIERITNNGAEIDILPEDDVQHFLQQKPPPGVSKMTLVDKATVRVQYNPRVIGARDLVEQKFSSPVKLASPQPDPATSAGSKHVREVGLRTLFSVVLTVPVLVLAWSPIPKRPVPYGAASLALATVIQVIVAGPFYPMALRSLVFSRMIEMDLLIVLSTTAAYAFSVISFGFLVSGRPLSTGQFFETSTLLVTLIMVGRFVSALARQKAVESISMRSLQSHRALLLAEDGSTVDIDARLLQRGDRFKVVPDSRVPTDGTTVSGISEVDESMVTGESLPVEKAPGSTVIAGSINGSGTLVVQLTRLPGDNTITTIAAMVDEAKLSKPKIQDIADRVAGYFVPVIVSLATITFSVWIAVGVAVRNQSGSEAAINAITYAITVLIVSCPCAIGLAVPMVVVIAGGVAAEHGVIFKTPDTIELAHRTTHVVFDKTGTLTEGKLAVTDEQYLMGRETVAPILLGLVSDVRHPVSLAIADHLKAQGVAPATVEGVTTHAGKGVKGTHCRSIIRAGNSRWLQQQSHPQVQLMLSKECTVFCVVIGEDLSVIFGLTDSLRPDATKVVSGLQRRNVDVSIVSGDDYTAVQSTAQKLGVSQFRSRCSPLDKKKYLQAITDINPKAVTLFCGDGTNDAVALAQATIGVHMSEGGTDVAQSAADAVLVRPSLTGIVRLMDLSRAAMLRIYINFAWSFVYNLVVVLFASGALVRVRLPPEYGGLGELVSVLPVILIAVQLKWSASAKRG